MKFKFLSLIPLLLCAIPAFAQVPSYVEPDCYIEANFTATGRSVAYDNRPTSPNDKNGCTRWTLSYYTASTISAVSIEIDEAPDASTGTSGIPGTPGSWVVFPQTASGALPLTTAPGSGQITVFKYYPWVSINLNSFTGSGLIKAIALGWKPDATSDSNAAPNFHIVTAPALSAPGSGQTAITASSGTLAATAGTCTLPGVAGKTTYITGFQITGAGATGASVIAPTVTGTVTGTMTYELAIPAGVTTGVTPLVVAFSIPIPASALNTAVVVNIPSFGAGSTNAACSAQGFQQ